MADPDDTTPDDSPEADPRTAARFSEHWLRMSKILLAELERRDLMDTPEAQAVLGARRKHVRRAAPVRMEGQKRRRGRPETKWERFLRTVGRGPSKGPSKPRAAAKRK